VNSPRTVAATSSFLNVVNVLSNYQFDRGDQFDLECSLRHLGRFFNVIEAEVEWPYGVDGDMGGSSG